jgi:hypothetical protein
MGISSSNYFQNPQSSAEQKYASDRENFVSASLDAVNEADGNFLNSTMPEMQIDRKLRQAQETLYAFLLERVKQWSPEEVLLEFKRLFLCQVDSISSDAIHAVYELVFSNNETEFRNTLKRCCYILINNWDSARHYKAVQDLIQAFQDITISPYTISPTLKRLKIWIDNFKGSQDYEELRLFTTRYEDRQQETNWISRYTSYLLVPQYVDLANPVEQREAARALSQQLKDRFKFDLALYVAKSQAGSAPPEKLKNPTVLGDNVLNLIKTIVARRGQFSYANLANIFIKQIQNLSYLEFKNSLNKYLIYSVQQGEIIATLQQKLAEKLDVLYTDYHNNPISEALILRSCNRVIDYLTTENKQEPSSLFILLLSQGNPMTLVIVLLKIVLISKASRSHLEAQIAALIRYYERYPEQDCEWIVNFLEIFNVTFAIHAENVQYDLVNMRQKQENLSRRLTLNDYRVFSQMRSFPQSEESGNGTTP